MRDDEDDEKNRVLGGEVLLLFFLSFPNYHNKVSFRLKIDKISFDVDVAPTRAVRDDDDDDDDDDAL